MMAFFKCNVINKVRKYEAIESEADLTDWKMYKIKLKEFQKNINEHLTALVENEKFEGDQEIAVDEDSESSESEDTSPKRRSESEDTSPKRRLGSPSTNVKNKKISVIER